MKILLNFYYSYHLRSIPLSRETNRGQLRSYTLYKLVDENKDVYSYNLKHACGRQGSCHSSHLLRMNVSSILVFVPLFIFRNCQCLNELRARTFDLGNLTTRLSS